jgi:hypothetical protein
VAFTHAPLAAWCSIWLCEANICNCHFKSATMCSSTVFTHASTREAQERPRRMIVKTIIEA